MMLPAKTDQIWTDAANYFSPPCYAKIAPFPTAAIQYGSYMTTTILQGHSLNQNRAEEIARQLGGTLSSLSGSYQIATEQPPEAQIVNRLQQQYAADINTLPDSFVATEVKLLVTDMDSTLISIECIDEIADFIGIKPQIADITEATMRGEIDFETSLRRRMALLKGLEQSALDQVYNERLHLNPGAERMVSGLQRQGIKVALVSGGFTYFTDKLKERLGLDYTLANTLKFDDGKLTGAVDDEIVGAKAKADFLLQKCRELDIKPSQAVALGDGANDLLMMKEAGLSIAYHAKPKVQNEAHCALNRCGLEGVLGLLNLPA